MTREQRQYTGAKWTGNFLRNQVEEGQEIGFIMPDERNDAHYHVGEVQDIVRDDSPASPFTVLGEDIEHDDADLTEVVVGGEWNVYVLVGEWDDSFSEDWRVWAAHRTGEHRTVDKLYDWDASPESPDVYLGDVDEEKQREVHEGFNDLLDDLDAMLDDIRFVKDLAQQVMMEDITMAEYEEAVERREAQNGGSLALDAF